MTKEQERFEERKREIERERERGKERERGRGRKKHTITEGKRAVLVKKRKQEIRK